MGRGRRAYGHICNQEGRYGGGSLWKVFTNFFCFLTLSRKQGYGLRVRMEKDVTLGDKDSEWQGKNGLLDNPF